ncbi:MAG TPA: PAS domain S-box protein [Solirubrobacteraceae bacterium]|nr:PAS domain S-box protein [Solirubrobacteraceae bacterium]
MAPGGLAGRPGYVLAIAVTAATLAARAAPGIDVERDPGLVLFALPILLSAYAGGLGPGLVSTAIAALGTNVLLLAPGHGVSVPSGLRSAEWIGLIAVGAAASFVSAALQRSRAAAEADRRLYAVTLASIGDAVVATDVHGTVTFLNREAERLVGVSSDESVGRPLGAVVDAKDARTHTPVADWAVRGGASVPAHQRLLVCSRDGTEIPVESIAAPIRGRAGRHEGCVVVFRDRSEQDAAETMRREMALQQQLSKIAASAPGAMYAIRMPPEATTISIPYASPTIAQFCSASPEEVCADAAVFLNLIHPDDIDRVRETLVRSARRLSLWRCEFRIADALGAMVWMESNAMPEREADGGTLWYGFLSDVTERHEADVALREQAALVDLSSDAVFVRAADSDTLTSWSTGAERMYGWTAQRAIGRGAHELLRTQWPESLEAVDEALHSSGRWEGELVHVASDGREITVLSRQALQRDGTGAPRSILEINTDITRRKQREQELAAANARWQTVAENLPGATLLIFDEELRYTEAHGEALRALGISAEDIIGEPVGTASPGEPHPHVLAAFRGALEGQPAGFEATLGEWTFFARVVPLDLGNARRHGMVLSVDVTERQRSEQRRKLSEERFRTLLETAPDPIFGVAADGRITFASPRVTCVLGYEPDELVGQPIETLVPERLRGVHGSHRDAYVAAPTTRSMGAGRELFARRKDGSEIAVEISLGVADDRAGSVTTAVMVDITERMQLAQQLRQAQKLEAVGQLAGGVAHDFNNLLLVISGYCAAARDEIGDGPGADDLTEVQRAAERASELTRQLLAFSRRQVLNPVQLDLGEVARGVLPMLERLIGEDVEVVLLTEDGLPGVYADRTQMEQVIMNLSVNARDAMPTGGTLTIETRELQLDDAYAGQHVDVEAGRYVCLSVSDTGTGIDPEIAAHLFEPFYTSKEVGRGTGLGLATVHGIVTQSGGSIRVYSERGLGAAFKVFLPASTRAAVPAQVPVTDAPAGTETVLLCEDEDSVRRLMERILSRNGYTVLSAATPHEALDFARAHAEDIDILVSDVIMPGLSGPELANRMREHLPSLRTLFVSGYTAETARGRGNLPTGSALLEKPFNRAGLLRALRDLLDQQRTANGQD